MEQIERETGMDGMGVVTTILDMGQDLIENTDFLNAIGLETMEQKQAKANQKTFMLIGAAVFVLLILK